MDHKPTSGALGPELRWWLVGAWLTIGAAAGVGLGQPFTRWMMLLIPAAVIGAWLLWNTGAGRETGAAVLGLTICPVLLAIQAQNPPCYARGDVAGCEPGSTAGLFVLLAVVAVGAGTIILAAPLLRGRQRSETAG